MGLTILLVLCVILVFWSFIEDSEIIILAGFISTFAVLTLILSPLFTMGTAAGLDAFYLSNNDVYADAVQVYDSYATIDEEALISIAGAEYNKEIGSFIKDYRDSIVNYNRELYSKRQWAGNWFNGWFLIQPEHAKPIKLLKRSK